MEDFRLQVEAAVSFLNHRTSVKPRVLIILGTGLGGLAGAVEVEQSIPYAEIPHFPVSTVDGHAGNLLFGRLKGHNVAILQGRFHYYEGYSTRELTLPIRVLSLMGANILLLTNAAGGLNPSYAAGSLMAISDHINFIPENPLRGPNIDSWGPRFPDLSVAYDKELLAFAEQGAADLHLGLYKGIYAAIPGPSLETPAETRYLRSCGADAVGMSSVPEVIIARHAGMRVLALSVICNVNDPDNFCPILLEDVLQQAQQTESLLLSLLLEVLSRLSPSELSFSQ